MKALWISLLLFAAMTTLNAQELREDVAEVFSENSSYQESTAKLKITDDEFISYILNDWRRIAQNIEVLPPAKGSYATRVDAFNSSVMTFSETCQKLPPEEYLHFLDQILVLYEQKRISDRAFIHVFLPSFEKKDFLDVNYSHPRVAAILKKAIKLTPAEEANMRSALEATANGSLADNYMYDRSDDDPLPETLPGIKLKRPWGSFIRKYERLTGKKVPPDPDFPDEDQTRPARRPQANAGSDELIENGTSADDQSIINAIWVGFGCVFVVVLAAIIRLFRRNRY